MGVLKWVASRILAKKTELEAEEQDIRFQLMMCDVHMLHDY